MQDIKQCKECGHENPKKFMGKEYTSHAPNCSLDTNTLREEFMKEYKIGDDIAEFYTNKFNQKLEEIEQEIEKCSDFADSGDTLKQRILQIIKNKKI